MSYIPNETPQLHFNRALRFGPQHRPLHFIAQQRISHYQQQRCTAQLPNPQLKLIQPPDFI